MKDNKKQLKILLAIAISVMMIASMTLTASVTASAAEVTETNTAAEISVSYDISDATSFVFSDSGITVTEGAYGGYKIDGTSLTIKESGTYIVSGNCANGTIVIKKNVTGVTLVLNGLTLSASATAPITCNKGSEVTIVAAAGSVNDLADDMYNNDDIYTDEELYPDIENAVIKCKDGSNVTICGTGTINITANGKNGIKGGYDLYEEDDDGNVTDTLISTASLTIKEVTLNITANVNDGLKSDKELNILSGNITVSAVDDGIKCDYVLNIGEEGTDGPTINVKKATEGIEAATLNVYSGNITVNATDDGINAANSDLDRYSFSYNQYGGYVVVNVTNGDGIDSNGTINLCGGTLEVYSPAQGDGDPLDSENGTYFKGATVLAVGHLGMAQGYSATTPYVTFGSANGNTGGRAGGFGGTQTNLVTAGSTITITDTSGNLLYTAKAVRNASYILFASPELTSGATYTLKNGTAAAATATAGNASTGGMGMGGQMPGSIGGEQGQMPGNNGGEQGQMPGNNGGEQGQMPGNIGGEQSQMPGNNGNDQGRMPGGSDQAQQPGNEAGIQGQVPENGENQGQFPENGYAPGQVPGMNGTQDRTRNGRQSGGFPDQNRENNGETAAPPEMNEGTTPEMPGNATGKTPQFPEQNGGFGGPELNADEEMPSPPEMNGEMKERPEEEIPQKAEKDERPGDVPQMPEEGEANGHHKRNDEASDPTEAQEMPEELVENLNWIQKLINAIRDFIMSLFR
ncbi:MAG: carbohydrate-binding domain-containing protein [Clostridia bacterium]|nr:carbohydrate-binding domain-containing protein [Clostridia bacterium]